MKTSKFHSFHSIKLSTKIIFVFFSVLFLVFCLFSCFGKSITPKFIHIAELNLNRYLEKVASDFKSFSLEKNNSDEFLIIRENSKGEITSIDYNLSKIYEISNRFTENIQNSIENSSHIEAIPYLDNSLKNGGSNGFLLSIPMGAISDNIFLSNLGPKIPVFIHFIGSVFTQVKTKVTDYGINNALLDVYLKVQVTYEIVTPILEEQKQLEYDLLIDSKVVQGIVPNWYGKTFESMSTFFEVSFP